MTLVNVRRSMWLSCLACVVLCSSAAAQSTGTPVTVHGFGGWAAGYSDNDNVFGRIANHDLAVDNYYFALNASAQPTTSLAVYTQVHWNKDLWGDSVQVDHAFVNWTPVEGVALRAGKIKNPLGIYSDILFVGTLRPFYLLPQGLYFDVPDGYVGMGANLRRKLDRWELEADVIGGQMEFQESYADLVVGLDPATAQPLWASLHTRSEGRDFIGGGFVLHPPVEGLEVGASAYSINTWSGVAGGPLQRTGDKRTNVVAGSGEFVRERVTLRAEGMHVSGESEFSAFYAEAAFKPTSHWQAAVSFDWRNNKVPPLPLKVLGDHHSLGLALNYWIHPTVVAKLDYYMITGNRQARPEDAVNLAFAGKLDKKTQVVIFGTQFAF
jgi:hypothetical protein